MFFVNSAVMPNSQGAEKVENYLRRAILISCDQSRGAGFQISNQYIATAKHVVENCNAPVIRDSEGNQTVGIRIIDSPNKDISFIEVNKSLTPSQDLKDFEFGSDKVVYTVGAPIDGLVMSKGTYLGEESNSGTQYIDLKIPADHGNSGGPVFQGTNVVGLVVLKSSTDDSIFAIKSSQVKSEFDQLADYANNSRVTVMPDLGKPNIFGMTWQLFAAFIFTLGLIAGIAMVRIINLTSKPKLPKFRLSI